MTAHASPRPPPVDPRLYSAELLQTFAAGEHAAFLAAGGLSLRPRLARSLALADVRPGQTVVDVGCGRGEVAVHAARLGARVIAVDSSLGAVGLTRATLRTVAPETLAAGAITPIAADATALPLPDRSADRVLLLDVVEHLHPWQLQAALAEVRRIVRPPGYVIIHTLPNRWALAIAYPWLRFFQPDLPRDPRSAYERAVHVNEQDPWHLQRTLGASGLRSCVWVEDWTSRHAMRGQGLRYPDAARAQGYGAIRRPAIRWLMRLAMATPVRWVVANDIFALAWPQGAPVPNGPDSAGTWNGMR